MDSQNCELPFTGIWYGKATTTKNAMKLWENIELFSEEREKLWTTIELLKIGEFSAKRQLTEIMIKSKNEDIRKLSLRVFCSVAKHEDIEQGYDIQRPIHEHLVR